MWFSYYERSDGDVDSEETDEDGEPRHKRRKKRVVYDERCDHKNLKLEKGMRFENGYQARDAIKAHAIVDGRDIHFKRVSQTQMQAFCNDPCKWYCYASIDSSNGHFIIKTLYGSHTCPLAVRNRQVTATWIAKHYINVFRYRPEITVKELSADILQMFNVIVSRWKLYNARDKVIHILRGTVGEHYAKLRGYVLELMSTDKEGRLELWLDVGAAFKGIYIGFNALRKGYKTGCRRVIGLDGAHLKRFFQHLKQALLREWKPWDRPGEYLEECLFIGGQHLNNKERQRRSEARLRLKTLKTLKMLVVSA